MIAEISNKEKLLNMQKLLDEFLNNYDCKGINCDKCVHEKICHHINKLESLITRKYLK